MLRLPLIVRKSLLLLMAGALLGMPPAHAADDVGLFENIPTSAIAHPVIDETYVLYHSVLYVYTSMGWQSLLPAKNNLAGSVAPSITDDSGSGYSPGSHWIDTTHSQAYICLNATVGAAVWKQYTDRLGPADIVQKLNAADYLSDWLVSGLFGTVPGSPSLAMTTPSGVAVVGGNRIVKGSSPFTYTASRDSYEYLQSDGTLNRVVLTNGASAPTGQPGLPLQKIVTDGTHITAVTQLAALTPTIVSPGNFQLAKVVATEAHPQFPNAKIILGDAPIVVDTTIPNEVHISLSGTAPDSTTSNVWHGVQEFVDGIKLDGNIIKNAANQNITIPSTADTLLGRVSTDIVQNKTFQSPKIGDNTLITAAGVSQYLQESTGDTFVYRNTTDTLEHKILHNPAITGTCTIATPWTMAQVNHAIKSKTVQFSTSQPFVDSTPYYFFKMLERAGTITHISVVGNTIPASGTATISIQKGSFAGPSILAGSNFDLGSLVGATVTPLSLTATAPDLHILATEPLAFIVTTGVQVTPLDCFTVSIEYELDDF